HSPEEILGLRIGISLRLSQETPLALATGVCLLTPSNFQSIDVPPVLFFAANMKTHKLHRLIAATSIILGLFLSFGCQRSNQPSKELTLAVNSGVEGDALKQAARDYEARTGVHINIAGFPYANLFEKELIDLNSRTGAYDLIMLDDPWFPKFASLNVLTDFGPLLQARGKTDPENDFIAASIA